MRHAVIDSEAGVQFRKFGLLAVVGGLLLLLCEAAGFAVGAGAFCAITLADVNNKTSGTVIKCTVRRVCQSPNNEDNQ